MYLSCFEELSLQSVDIWDVGHWSYQNALIIEVVSHLFKQINKYVINFRITVFKI